MGILDHPDEIMPKEWAVQAEAVGNELLEEFDGITKDLKNVGHWAQEQVNSMVDWIDQTETWIDVAQSKIDELPNAIEATIEDAFQQALEEEEARLSELVGAIVGSVLEQLNTIESAIQETTQHLAEKIDAWLGSATEEVASHCDEAVADLIVDVGEFSATVADQLVELLQQGREDLLVVIRRNLAANGEERGAADSLKARLKEEFNIAEDVVQQVQNLA